MPQFAHRPAKHSKSVRTVTSQTVFQSTISSAQPGDVIQITGGNAYDFGAPGINSPGASFNSIGSTSELPIIIQPKPGTGEVIIRSRHTNPTDIANESGFYFGKTMQVISWKNVIIEGITFDEGLCITCPGGSGGDLEDLDIIFNIDTATGEADNANLNTDAPGVRAANRKLFFDTLLATGWRPSEQVTVRNCRFITRGLHLVGSMNCRIVNNSFEQIGVHRAGGISNSKGGGHEIANNTIAMLPAPSGNVNAGGVAIRHDMNEGIRTISFTGWCWIHHNTVTGLAGISRGITTDVCTHSNIIEDNTVDGGNISLNQQFVAWHDVWRRNKAVNSGRIGSDGVFPTNKFPALHGRESYSQADPNKWNNSCLYECNNWSRTLSADETNSLRINASRNCTYTNNRVGGVVVQTPGDQFSSHGNTWNGSSTLPASFSDVPNICVS